MHFVILDFKLKRYAKRQDIILPDDYKLRLLKYQNVSKQINYNIILSWKFNLSDKINASANIPFCIVFNRAWIKQIVWNGSADVYNAFKASIGHELTHKGGDFSCRSGRPLVRSFIAYVNEVHADFGGAQKMLDCNRDCLLRAIRFKQSINEPLQKNSFSKTHPTWQQRYDYIANHNFNEELIRKIAVDMDFDNEQLIQQISDHFEEIYLN